MQKPSIHVTECLLGFIHKSIKSEEWEYSDHVRIRVTCAVVGWWLGSTLLNEDWELESLLCWGHSYVLLWHSCVLRSGNVPWCSLQLTTCCCYHGCLCTVINHSGKYLEDAFVTWLASVCYSRCSRVLTDYYVAASAADVNEAPTAATTPSLRQRTGQL